MKVLERRAQAGLEAKAALPVPTCSGRMVGTGETRRGADESVRWSVH